MKENKSTAVNITFKPLGRKVLVKNETNVLDVALNHNIAVDNSCGGSGSCGTCRIKVLCSKNKLNKPNEVEMAMIQDRGFDETERLSCQIQPVDGLIVEVPD